MDPFVRRLVRRLNEPSRPLSRNRHYATFDSPEGRQALRLSRLLRSLQRDILICRREGGAARIVRTGERGEPARVELQLQRIRGARVARLLESELELLQELPGVNDALREDHDSDVAGEEGPRSVSGS